MLGVELSPDTLILIGSNLVSVGVAYGMLHNDQKSLKETVNSMKNEFSEKITELKKDFSDRNNELRNDVLKARERIHQLTDVLMEIGRGKAP